MLTFVIDIKTDSQYQQLITAATSTKNSYRSGKDLDHSENALLQILLCGCENQSALNENASGSLNQFLIKFHTQYVSRRTNEKVKPRSMLCDVGAVQRFLRELGFGGDFLKDPAYINPEYKLYNVLNNKVAPEQSIGS